jgi:hypothetical protein
MLCLQLVSAYCQKVEIRGRVTDYKENPLMFASVGIKDSFDGATADENGEFVFSASQEGRQTLICSYIGYKPFNKEIIVEEGKNIYIEILLDEETAQVAEVVITAGSFEAGDVKRSVVMSSMDIGTTAGATGDITRAIETLPGVQAVGESNGLFVRGGDGSESKVIIDEMAVQNPYFSPVPDLKQRGRFDPFMFSGTVFSTGGYSAQYGQGLSSVLALQSNGLADSTNTGAGLYAYGANIFHVHRWDSTSVYLKGEYNNFAPYYRIFKQITAWEKSPENAGTTLNFRHKFSEDDMLKLYINYSITKLSMKYVSNDTLDQKNLFSLQNNNLYINSTYKRHFKNNLWSAFVGASYSNDRDDAYADSINMSEKEKLSQLKVVITNSSLAILTLSAGSEVRLMNIRGREGSLSGTINDVFAACFLEGNLSITPRLLTRLGVRYEYSDLLVKSNVAPRLSLAYKTGENTQVSFAYGRFYQLPLNDYLYYSHNLSYENAAHYIINFQLMKNRRIFRIELYDKEYRKLVKYGPEGEHVYNNSGFGFARGIDIFWRDQKSIPNADYWISYSFLYTKRLYRDYPVEAVPDFASKHNLSFVYKHWFGIVNSYIGLTYSFASGRPYYNPNRPESEFHMDITPVYSNLSINISKMLSIFGRSSVIYISLDNVTGTSQIFGYHYLPDNRGKIPIQPSSVRSFFIGFFISTY